MGIEHMRGNYGRCPPFLFGGLVLVCLIITVNWWSLSTQNNDLVRQLEDLGEKFKLSSDQREQCIQLRMVLDNRLKNTEEELAQVRVRLEKMKIEINKMKTEESQKDEEIKSLQKNAGDAQNTVSMCGSELESLKKLDISKDGTIASLKIEKDKYSNKIDEKDQEIAKLQSELEQVRQEMNVLKTDIEASKASIPVVDQGNQHGELDDNHGGERGDEEVEIPALPEKKNRDQVGKKMLTKKPLPDNDDIKLESHVGVINEKNKNAEDKGDEIKIKTKAENNPIRSPEFPPGNAS